MGCRQDARSAACLLRQSPSKTRPPNRRGRPRPQADGPVLASPHQRDRLSLGKTGAAREQAQDDGTQGWQAAGKGEPARSEEHTSELQSLMRNSYAVLSMKKKKT